MSRVEPLKCILWIDRLYCQAETELQVGLDNGMDVIETLGRVKTEKKLLYFWIKSEG